MVPITQIQITSISNGHSCDKLYLGTHHFLDYMLLVNFWVKYGTETGFWLQIKLKI